MVKQQAELQDYSGGSNSFGDNVQGGSKSVSPLAHIKSFSNTLLKNAMPIIVALPLTLFLGRISVQLYMIS